ncbi:DUF2334 domain-containing protein [Halobacillus litoralis]|uniref:DUF2334 domain-containing protein n=1 Tax=Halobacillus litoralis TaxID=45668 RepID=A0A845DWY3_9BACI|nr:polysaccharide deacetylase family protein [Halobacillus litoralis]MYL20832.1 DUF2334 domain-containing protein [Halobacillus litoralis]
MKKYLIVLCALLMVFASTGPVSAEPAAEDKKTLVVYSSVNHQVDEDERKLDMLLSHFTKNIDFVHVSEFQPGDTKDTTHIFYYGSRNEQLPDSFLASMNSYEGTLTVIGHNQNQFKDHFSFEASPKLSNFNFMYLDGEKEEKIKIPLQSVFTVPVNEEIEVLAWAEGGKKAKPLVMEENGAYYAASPDVISPVSTLFGDVLHDIYQSSHEESHPGYIRLEDIHPLVDPEKLKETGEVLIENDIPFMMAVIPVYTDPETGRRSHFSDYPETLEVIQYLQENGGSVVLHGYTHQYRASETGEGFEFWDVENNTPIYKEGRDPSPIKRPDDFHTRDAYQDYMAELKDFERDYTETKLNKGIQELTGFGLYPLAFEPPHYTMSQHGYEIASEFFSTYVGQMQLSDENWQVMDSAPYSTSPSFTHGMTVLPETLGYVEPDNKQAAEEIIQKAEQQMMVRDGMVSFFYHPYLGAERLSEVIDGLKDRPIEWIDLKEENTKVQSDEVTITAADGNVNVDKNTFQLFTDSKTLFHYFVQNTADKVTWTMVGVSSLSVLLFCFYTFVSYRRLTQNERSDQVG